jgi:cytochrome c553
MKSVLFLSLVLISNLLFAQDAKKGSELYKQCILCHGDKGDGNVAQKAPRISGQHDWYILKQLQDMKAQKVRKNPLMNPFLSKLSEQDMKDLAAYISKL